MSIDRGSHPLSREQGAHAAIVRVSRGLTSHVVGLDVCLDDAFGFEVQRRLTDRGARPLLRGTVQVDGVRTCLGLRAVDEHERSFDLYVVTGRELTLVGSLRLGQRVAVPGEATRHAWTFGLVKAAA